MNKMSDVEVTSATLFGPYNQPKNKRSRKAYERWTKTGSENIIQSEAAKFPLFIQYSGIESLWMGRAGHDI
jgi:hypothetical protein